MKIISLLSLLSLSLSCSSPPDRATQVKQRLQTIEEAIEEKDLEKLKEQISAEFQDQRGYRRQELLSLLQLHFLKQRSLHILTQLKELRFEAGEAQVELSVAVAGTGLPGLEALSQVKADILVMTLNLRKEEDSWRLIRADWRRGSMADFAI